MMKKTIWTKALCLVTAFSMCLGVASTMKLSANAQSEPLTGKTAMEISQMMDKGWNLGNTFDATGGKAGDIASHETSWGNPVTNRELIAGVKAAGYSTIRIPVTWAKHMSNEDGHYTVEPEFLARIKEVIDWCYEEDLFIILNVHHEGWLNKETFDEDYVEIGNRLGDLWSVVADYFKDYDQHLIFEGMNEPRAQGTSNEWNPHPAGNDAVNYLNQVFVNAVRTNAEGYNAERVLGIPGYAASNSATGLRAIAIPEFDGQPVNNIMISIHCYSPYEFCLTDKKDTFSEVNSGDTSDIKRMMSDIDSLFISNGIAAYIGECGATNSGNNLEARIAWFNYFGKITREANIPAIVWDNGSDGISSGECHVYLRRKTGELAYPELTQAFIYGYDPSAEAKNVTYDFEPAKQGDSTVVITPADMGFAPKQIMNQAKVNHTENAAVGFALKIAKNLDNHTATYDLSKYAGNCLKITFYALSETEGAKVGYEVDGNKTENLLLPSGDWQEVNFAIKLDEGSKAGLFFAGNGEDTIYIDDLSIEMVSEEELSEFAASLSADSSDEALAESDEPASKDEEKPNSDVKETGSSFMTIAGIALAVVCIVCGLLLTLKRKKDK